MKKNYIIASVGIALLSGCATTKQARQTNTSGFLGDYSALTAGEKGEALLRYVDQNADFSKYTKVLLEPIQIYATPDSKLANLPPSDFQALLDYFEATVRAELSKEYRLVQVADDHTLHIRIALTESQGSKLVLDTLSATIPIGMAISAVKEISEGTPTSVGRARVELEITDALTEDRLVAAVDERAGKKYTGRFDRWSKWQDAKDAYDYWAKQLATRLKEFKTNSVKH